MFYVVQVVRLLIPAIAGWVLCRQLGILPAVGIALVCAIGFPLLGSMLLRSVVDGEVTWRNLVAGWLLPWGYRIGRGKLLAIGIISGIVWMLLMILGIIAASPPVEGMETKHVTLSSGVINILLALSWLVDGTALFYLAGQLSRNTDITRPPGSTLAKLAAIVGGLIAVSAAFWLAGQSQAALWIGGFPPLVVGVLTGAWVIILVTVGRNARWN